MRQRNVEQLVQVGMAVVRNYVSNRRLSAEEHPSTRVMVLGAIVGEVACQRRLRGQARAPGEVVSRSGCVKAGLPPARRAR